MNKFIKISGGIVLVIAAVIGIVSAIIDPAEKSVYYVDSTAGNDNNSGTSKAAPWKSLSSVNSHTFQPGDKILLKAGSIWKENLTLKGSGTAANPIVIGMYGSGIKPMIIGQSKQINEVVRISNLEFWEISNLNISGEYAINGIYLEAGPEIINHIYIMDCEIHHLTIGGGYSKGNGIRINGRNRFNDIRITNNYFHDLSGDGFMVNGDANSRNITNLYVAYNSVINVAGDGIVIRDAYKSLTEYNYVNNSSYMAVGSHAAIWCAFTDSAVFQFNEACYTKKPTNNFDGMAYDADLRAKGTIFQYNYSHDNEGGFHLSMNQDSTEIVRYNISENDILGLFRRFPAATCLIYNNVFYGPGPLINQSPNDIKKYGKRATTIGGTWYNNIFWSTDSIYSLPQLESNNITWGKATGGIHVDPQLIHPGDGGTRINMKDKSRLSGYRLKSASPCINAGKVIAGNGSRDFWGNPLYKGFPDIGAMEFAR